MTSLLEKLVRREDLFEEEAQDLLQLLTDPRTDPVLSGGLLAALRTKGPVANEIRGLAKGMRKLATPIPLDSFGDEAVVDIVGTGGDGSGSVNISTGSALLAASCGLRVAKHGNRSVSSHSGAADVLEALGYVSPASAEGVVTGLNELGFAFIFAPYFHPAMKGVAPVRASLGIRTVFNILGPLTNPAQPGYYVIGAYSTAIARLMADALSGLSIERAFVVHGEPGWDEATPCGPFLLYDVRPGRVVEEHRDPRDYGIDRCDPSDLAGGNAQYNAAALRDAFEGAAGAHAEALALGAGLALEVTGAVGTLDAGIDQARGAIEDGSAADLTRRLAG